MDKQQSKTDQRIGKLEKKTVSLNQQIESIVIQATPGAINGGSGSAATGSPAVKIDYEPRFSQIESRIDELQKTLGKLRGSIVSSTDPKETTDLKQQLLSLTEQVMQLKKRLQAEEMEAAVKADAATIGISSPVKPEPAATTVAGETESVEKKQPKLQLIAKPTEQVPEATEEKPAKPAAQTTKSGLWGINLRSYAKRPLAEKGQLELKTKELNAEIQEAEVSGKTWYRLRLEGFSSSHEAKRYIKEQLADAGFTGAWISKKE